MQAAESGQFGTTNLTYFVQEEDIGSINVFMSRATQKEKNEALCNACIAKKCNDLIKKQEMIATLIKGGAQITALKGGVSPLQIIEFHQVWYKQRKVYDELRSLVELKAE